MKRLGALTCLAVTFLTVLALMIPLTAQEQPQQSHQTHYTVQDLGTLGGTFSWAIGINNKGSVAGIATLSGDAAQHGFLWQKGQMTDLGTLGGPNSNPQYKPNERDELVGTAETSAPDPSGDDFCPFGTDLTCLPFFWRNGVMNPLPTLGGNNGVAVSVNNRGQVVGVAENSTSESTCFHLFQLKPVIWKNSQIEELPTLSGDTEGYAHGINDQGQIVGWTITTDCTVFHSVLWEKGTVTDMGSLGGTFNYAWSINNQGQAFGISNLPGDLTGHAFLWQKNVGMTDLGTLPGDFFSQAWSIDNKGRVVGTSCDASGNCRAFLWQDDVMVDINTLIPADSQWFLWEADGINARGEIVGLAFNTTTGEGHGFLLTPKESGFAAASDSLVAPSNHQTKPKFVLPESVRRLLQRERRRLGGFERGVFEPR